MRSPSTGFLSLVVSGLITAVFCAALPSQAATNLKLSGVMPAFGDVVLFQVSPDGRFAVYLADQDTDSVLELYSVLLGSGSPVRLNPPFPVGRNVFDFQISPDSQWVVYRADQDTDNMNEIYCVPIGGPTAAAPLIKLNGIMTALGNVATFRISPNSSRLVYQADQETDGVVELYSVPLRGPVSAGRKLNKALVAGGNVAGFQISPDSSRVVYGADQETDGATEIYSVPIAGPAAEGLKLNKPLVAPGGSVQSDALISPDSERVLYRADQETDEVFELYSVPLLGPASLGVKLNKTLIAGGDVKGFRLSPVCCRVVYGADQEMVGHTELYSVPITGPASDGLKLNKPLVPGGNVEDGYISSDGKHLVYRADQDANGVLELYSVPVSGPASAGLKLNKPLAPGGNVSNVLLISPDSRRVVYAADQDTDTVPELYSVPIAGPAAAGLKLNKAFVPGGGLDPLIIISPDSSRVIYLASQDTVGVHELYSVPLTGPADAGIKLNGPLVTGGSLTPVVQISSDSGRVVYIAEQDTDGVRELYMTSSYSTRLPLILR